MRNRLAHEITAAFAKLLMQPAFAIVSAAKLIDDKQMRRLQTIIERSGVEMNPYKYKQAIKSIGEVILLCLIC